MPPKTGPTIASSSGQYYRHVPDGYPRTNKLKRVGTPVLHHEPPGRQSQHTATESRRSGQPYFDTVR
jgi:hypothetical protein